MNYFKIILLAFESNIEANMALFTDLSKAFDIINHDLLLAKRKPYDFSKLALTLRCSYLENRKKRVVIKNRASTAKKRCRRSPRIYRWLFGSFMYKSTSKTVSIFSGYQTILIKTNFYIAIKWQ